MVIEGDTGPAWPAGGGQPQLSPASPKSQASETCQLPAGTVQCMLRGAFLLTIYV